MQHLDILVNVDESLINQNTMKNYSWLKRGSSWWIRNSKFHNSINMVSMITTKGYSLNLYKHTTTLSSDFINFLRFAIHFIKLNNGIDPRKVGIIVDNCPCHRAKKVMEFAKEQQLKLFYLPSYWPELAPIESYFSKLKHSVIVNAKEERINLKTKNGVKMIKDISSTVERKYIKSLWGRFIKDVQQKISSVDSSLMRL